MKHPRSTEPEGPAIAALRLALGRVVSEPDLDWDRTLEVAVRERLAVLGWARSGRQIRAGAAPRTVGDWRTVALVADRRGCEKLGLLQSCVDALKGRGILPIVVKGMPLSQRLYGNPFLRTSADIDLYVPSEQRGVARSVILELGWTHLSGEPPWDDVFRRVDDSSSYLELHERLSSDYLAHLPPIVPEGAPIVVAGIEVQAFAGDHLPAYLAAHLAGHQSAPLLWAIDFHTLWSQLGEDDRIAAVEGARRHRLSKYLHWAMRASSTVVRAAEGDLAALAGLGFRGSERRDDHIAILRQVRLAANAEDALRVAGACVWPRPLRNHPRQYVETVKQRLRRRLRSSGRNVGHPARSRAAVAPVAGFEVLVSEP